YIGHDLADLRRTDLGPMLRRLGLTSMSGAQPRPELVRPLKAAVRCRNFCLRFIGRHPSGLPVAAIRKVDERAMLATPDRRDESDLGLNGFGLGQTFTDLDFGEDAACASDNAREMLIVMLCTNALVMQPPAARTFSDIARHTIRP